MTAIRRRPSIARRVRATRNRIRAERLAADSPTADRIVAAIGPVAARYGMGPPQGGGDSIVWCTSSDELRTIGRNDDVDVDDDDGSLGCTDLTVSIDQANRSIGVDVDGHGLAEFLTGRSHWDGPTNIRLADDLDVALGHVATHLDRLCQSVIITDR